MKLNRSLEILVDDVSVAGGCRVLFSGMKRLSLYPELLIVNILNLSDDKYRLIRLGGSLKVKCAGSLLASGVIQDVSRETYSDGVRTSVGFSLGWDLWDNKVSLDVPKETLTSVTVEEILEASGTPWKLLSFPGEDPYYMCGQAFFGSAAECIERAISSAGARACLVNSGLVISPKNPEKIEVHLTEEDLVNAPVFARDCVILSTIMVGWPIGRRLQLDYRGKITDAVIVRQRFNADTGDGPWMTEIMAEVLNV